MRWRYGSSAGPRPGRRQEPAPPLRRQRWQAWTLSWDLPRSFFVIRGRNATRRRKRECRLHAPMTRRKTDSRCRHLPAIRRVLLAHAYTAGIGVEAALLDEGTARGEAATDGEVHQ